MMLRWLMIAVLTWMLAGCQSAEVRARHARRAENRARTIGMLRESEAQRGEKLAATMALIESRYDRDGRQAGENAIALERWWAEPFERWEVARPIYARRFREILAGDPASIHRTLPMFLD